MDKWATWQTIDKKLTIAWEQNDPGYKARIGSHIFRLHQNNNEWIWEISDLETGNYYSGRTTSKQTALEDINFQLKLIYW